MTEILKIIIQVSLYYTDLVITGSNINFKEEIPAFGLKVSSNTSKA